VFKMYANESEGGKWPMIIHSVTNEELQDAAYPGDMVAAKAASCTVPLDPGFVNWVGALQVSQVYPEYLTDMNIMYCPSAAIGARALEDGWMNMGGDPNGPFDPCRIGFRGSYGEYWDLSGASGDFGTAITPANHSYEYVGYALNHAIALEQYGIDYVREVAWVQCSLQWGTGDCSAVDQDISMEAGGSVYRLKEGIERFFITDINNPGGSTVAQSELPVMWDQIQFRETGGGVSFNHLPGGSNILYMDGHVVFERYPGEFPIHPGYMWRPG
jgi:prepilin-type processing-associated H-X9-DG protein